MVTTSSCSNVNVGPEVFINFRGKELRSSFVSHLHKALVQSGIKAFIDSDMDPGEKLITLFKTIEESKIALAILSSKYTESRWCLDELVKIKECGTKGEGCKNLLVIPIFYKLDISIVKKLEGDFGVNLLNVWREPGGVRDNRIVKWNAALQDMLSRTALIYDGSMYVNNLKYFIYFYKMMIVLASFWYLIFGRIYTIKLQLDFDPCFESADFSLDGKIKFMN